MYIWICQPGGRDTWNMLIVIRCTEWVLSQCYNSIMTVFFHWVNRWLLFVFIGQETPCTEVRNANRK